MSLRRAQKLLATLSVATLAARFSRRDSFGDVHTFDFASGAEPKFHHVGGGSLASSNKKLFRRAEFKNLGTTVLKVCEHLEMACMTTRGCVGYHVNVDENDSQYLFGALLLDKTSDWPFPMSPILTYMGASNTWNGWGESQEEGPAYTDAATAELFIGFWGDSWQAFANPFYLPPTTTIATTSAETTTTTNTSTTTSMTSVWTGLFPHVGAGSLVSNNKKRFRTAQYKHLGVTVNQVRWVLQYACMATRGCVGYHAHSQYLVGALLLDKTADWPLPMPDLLSKMGAINTWNGYGDSQEVGPAYTDAATVELGMGWGTGWQAYVNPYFNA